MSAAQVPPGCREFQDSLRSTRREFIQAGLLGTAGLALPAVLACEAQAREQGVEPAAGRNNVIILWMRGGPSHIDMWDPKPEAPVEYRGEFGTIPTRVPGIQLTDMLPRCAEVMQHWSIVRSLYHQDAGHSTGDQICFTGYPSGPNGDENIHPSCCAIAAEQLGGFDLEIPASVMIPRLVPGTGAAYLGVANKPFETLADPAANGPFQVPNFELTQGLSVDRLGERRGLLSGFDRLRRQVDSKGQLGSVDRFQEQAWGILTSRRARDAFDLDAEPRTVREWYGFVPEFNPGASNRCGAPAWSQRILLARRLIEAGVRMVTVDLRWWDTHVLGFDSLRRGFLPRFDQAYSALISDLQERGLLETTLVVAWGEFGRTPRVNNDAGRDHYPNVFSAALAGGPIRGGLVLGASDAKGAFPKSQPKTPQDVLATIYRHLGIDPNRQYLNSAGRPIAVLPSGTPLTELM